MAYSYMLKVASGSVELVIGQLPYSWDFFQRADIANVMGFRKVYLTYRVPQPITAIWTIFYPFVTPLWIALILSTLIVTCVLLAINALVLKEDNPTFHIIAISLLSILSESFPNRWFHENISSKVILVLYVWLPMSFLLGSVYRSGLLQFLVAGENEDPPDTFQKVLERDLIIVMATGTLFEQLFQTAPYESMRLAYKHGEEKGGYFPWNKGSLALEWLQEAVADGKAVGFSTSNLHIGNRHRSLKSKNEHVVGIMLHGFVFKRNSQLLQRIHPILTMIIDTGIYEHLKDKFLWHRARRERDYYRLHSKENLVVLTWNHVGWTFLLVASCGLALASLVFVFEVLLFGRRTSYKYTKSVLGWILPIEPAIYL